MKDVVLICCFNEVLVNELSVKDMVEILKGICEKFEIYY